MAIKRRHFLGWLTATPVMLASFSGQAFATTEPLYASASQGQDGQYYLHLFNLQAGELMRHPLPERAHQITTHPELPWLFAVARRPGQFLDVIDYQQKTLIKRIQCDADSQLCGHAQISADGQWLLTTEQSMHREFGEIVVRDIHQNFNIAARLSTYGIGPHELRIGTDQHTLIIANGGIQTDGRVNLNIDSMDPSLAYVDMHSGECLEQVRLAGEFHQSGIRHIDLSASGQVIMAMQYEGHPADRVPLIASHRPGQAIQPLALPDDVHSQLQQYGGSACFDASGHYAAVSAPKGNLITLWDMQAGTFITALRVQDGCGLAKTQQPAEFLVSNGLGRLYRLNAQTRQRQLIKQSTDFSVHWDNHLASLAVS
ncbi:hypothetical protein LH51_14355 [Nitrincola sp. A-D6]|uniref:DUF1513 domain-containing protein n=1 Tax=Nitrincola sp. A-D6 TaxID=1545442 RepID=UPI00051FA464|nr:DUF1513 domain-containing protein [Nitrincola sp. A-D6]KGK41497.1 hypothetical protein LH51_14355 [Nitrincola sp. A-D6]